MQKTPCIEEDRTLTGLPEEGQRLCLFVCPCLLGLGLVLSRIKFLSLLTAKSNIEK